MYCDREVSLPNPCERCSVVVMVASRGRWLRVLLICGTAASGCATGQNADPDADGVFDDVGQKAPEDTGKSSNDTGEGDDAMVELDAGDLDAGTAIDHGVIDTDAMDGGVQDSGVIDTGPRDSGVIDTGPRDSGVIDTGPRDSGVIDTGGVDTGPIDTGPVDTGPVDAGGPTIMCPAFPFSVRTCRGTNACCLNVGGIAAGCGCLIPIFGLCGPCN